MFYTAPTLIRSLMQSGDDWVKAHDRGSLRVLGTVGEPIGEHAWNWFGAPACGHGHQLLRIAIIQYIWHRARGWSRPATGLSARDDLMWVPPIPRQ